MTEDLLRRANDLVAQTAETGEEVASRLDHLEKRARERQEKQRQLQEALAVEQRRSWVAAGVTLVAALLVMIGTAVASESFSVHVLSTVAGVLTLLVGVFAGRYESLVRKRVTLDVKRGKSPLG